MSERAIKFSYVFNFRDLGGYRARDGRSVRWRRLYRADDLSRLVHGDRERFASLRIRTVVDLRRPNEIDEDGKIPPLATFSYRNVHLAHPLWPKAEHADTTERMSFLLTRYRDMVEGAADGIGEALRLIANANAAPLVFHCIAGKDRTGIVAALTLALLGVDDADIADDYALSEHAEEPYWRWRASIDPRPRRPRRANVIMSPRAGMLGFLADLRARHGSVEDYAERVGVTSALVAAMRAHLLR